MIIISFGIFLLIFVIIGVLSTLKNQHTTVDYLLAGHSVKPWLVALSAIATNNSGFMFIGMIGYTYAFGVSSIWLMFGSIFGDFLASTFIHKKLRIHTEKQNAHSFAAAISKWHGTDHRILRFLGGIITVAFLGVYAAAQLNAGSKALHVIFNWDYYIGAIIGAIIVLLYCFSGGIRASIWTDAAQSFVMVVAMSMLCVFAISELGGINEFIKSLQSVSSDYASLFPQDLLLEGVLGLFLFALGWTFSGFAVVGQPHIMVRFMAMDNPENIGRVRLYYYSWYILFFTFTICTGLTARLLIPEIHSFDVELALPMLSQKLLPEILIGLVLAGLFSATMSTADSQILSCSAAITHDFTFKKNQCYLVTKLSTVFVTIFALVIALLGSKSVFVLVLMSWAALASSFAPLLVIYSLGYKVSEGLAITMMLSGATMVILWTYFGLQNAIPPSFPGIITGFFTYGTAKLFRRYAHHLE